MSETKMGDTDIKLRPAQKAMARRMAASWEIPQFSLETEVDCDRMIAYRASLPEKVSFVAIVAKVVGELLAEFPLLRTSWAEDHMVTHDDIHIGIAADSKRGLVVPVIRDADRKTLQEIDGDLREIKELAKTGLFRVEMLEGSVFTISNLGMYNVISFRSIVTAPESAILSVAKMTEKAVVKNGEIVIGKTMKLCLSIDHRVADGAMGARFLTRLAERLETL